MPSKSSRAASRQAQLRRKRRRGKARPQEFDVGPTESSRPAATVEAVEDTEAEAVVEAGETAVATSPPRPQPVARPTRRSARGTAPEPALSYPYLGSEVKRIAVISALIAIILAVLTFVLGS